MRAYRRAGVRRRATVREANRMATAGVLRTAVAVLAVAGCAPSPAGVGPLADGSDAAITAAVDAITHFPSGLDPRLWNDETLEHARDLGLDVGHGSATMSACRGEPPPPYPYGVPTVPSDEAKECVALRFKDAPLCVHHGPARNPTSRKPLRFVSS